MLLRLGRFLRFISFCIHGFHRPFPMLIEGWSWKQCLDCGKKLSTPTRIPWTLTVIPPKDSIK